MDTPALATLCPGTELHPCIRPPADAAVYCGCAPGACGHPAPATRILVTQVDPVPAEEIDFAAIETALDEAAYRLGVLYRRAVAEDRAEIRHIAAALGDIADVLGLPEPRLAEVR